MVLWIKDNIETSERICTVNKEITHLDGTKSIISVITENASDEEMHNAGYVTKEEHINNEIKNLKKLLADSDYKVIKCYEASVKGEELPYDLSAVIAERDGCRAEINSLEEELREYLAQL